MALVRFPKFMGGGPRVDREPAPDWDKEAEAIRCVGEWLAGLDTQEQRLRVLTYWMWRLKSKDDPKVEVWQDSIAEQSTMIVSKRHGFSEDGE